MNRTASSKPLLTLRTTDASGVGREYVALPLPTEPDPPTGAESLLGFRVRRRVAGLPPAGECMGSLDEATARWVGGGVFSFQLCALAFDGSRDVESCWSGCSWSPWAAAEVR